MGDYSRISCAIWSWMPFVELDYPTRNLWLALYTTPEAKRLVPGLWHGGIGTMSDAARMGGDEVLTSLDRLLERGLAEYDQRNRIVRLTQLPDAGERAYNGKSIKGWWSRFSTVPACAVRDSHVELLWWLVTQGSRPQEMLDAWNLTFGKISVPTRVVRPQRLVDSDTGTTNQPSLFRIPKNVDSERRSHGVSDTPSIYTGSGSGTGSGIGIPEGEEGSLRGEGDGPTTAQPWDRWSRKVHLQLVPAEPEPAVVDRAAEERNAYAREMRDAQRQVAEETGCSFLLTS